jgi:crossover junction endodeoxyribonuclease RuvC
MAAFFTDTPRHYDLASVIPCRKLSRMPAHPNDAETASLRRILGVDPAASGPTGFGVIETDGRNLRVLHYGALRIPSKRQKSSAGACLYDVHALLCQLIEEFHPNAMAVESVFTALNMRTALRLAEVRGVVLLAAEQHGVEVRSYSPREVKACVAGYGHADKKQMQLMVRALLKMEETPEPSDAADALAVALCHLQGEQFTRRFGLSNNPRPALTQKVAATVASRRQSTTRISGLQPTR